MRITSSGYGGWLAVLVVGTAIGWWVGRDHRLRWTAAWQREVDSLTYIVREQQAVLAVQRGKSDTAAVRVRRQATASHSAALQVQEAVDTARAVLRDSTANVAQLRATLEATSASASQLAEQVLTYEATLDTLLTAHLAERQAASDQMVTMQAVIDRQADALQDGCRPNFLGRCPTRWQAFGLGIVVAAIAVLTF